MERLEKFINEEIDRTLSLLSENSEYIGSCIDVGKGGAPVCQYFSDATELSNFVENPSRHTEIDRKKFFEFVDKEDVPEGAMEGDVKFFAVTYSPMPGQSLEVEESGLFYLYNWDKDIHYFFEV